MKKKSSHLQVMDAIGAVDTRMAVMETRMAVMETKQDELIRRVGIQNGRVADGEAALKKIVGEESYQKGSRNALKYIVSILLAAAAIIVAILFR